MSTRLQASLYSAKRVFLLGRFPVYSLASQKVPEGNKTNYEQHVKAFGNKDYESIFPFTVKFALEYEDLKEARGFKINDDREQLTNSMDASTRTLTG